MPSAHRRRVLSFVASATAVAVAAIVVALLARSPAETPAAGPEAPSISAPSTEPSSTFAPQRNTVVIAPTAEGTTIVHGIYPDVPSRCVDHAPRVLNARYPGALSVERAGDATLTLTLRMPFERYLEGIAEVPPSWPMAALEAQAVAARSYALARTGWTGEPGEKLREPICSTDACQVYSGLPIHPSRAIEPWADAVRRTGGQVLLSNGRPADALYFSTSNGHTYGNDVVFGSVPLSYLRPVAEHDDGESPEAHWQARISLRDLGRSLRAAGDWAAGHAISNIRLTGETVTVSGHGIARTLGVSTLRSDVNVWAHCLQPDRYPGLGSKGARLPLTVPSPWFTLATHGGAAVMTGRGWGHGVGMVQWGAYGKAKRGLSYRQILAYYYGGLRPVRIEEPGTIRVIVASGLTSLSMTASAPFTVDGRRAGITDLFVTGGERLTVTAGHG